MSKTVCIIWALLFAAVLNAQRHYFPAWTFHAKNARIHGLSLGFVNLDRGPKNTVTNGVRAELLGLGILIPMMPQSPVVASDSALLKTYGEQPYEKVNGLNLSVSGSLCNCVINGGSAGYIAQIIRKVNGVSAALAINIVQLSNGIQVAAMFTDSYRNNGLQAGCFNNGVYNKGLQVGIINHSAELRGIQIGLWNRNGRRAMPLLNWQFKPSKKQTGERTS